MFEELNILRPFLERSGSEFNVREVGRILKIAPATASNKLKLFVKKGILKERKERILKLYKLNLENDLCLDLKKFYNIRKIKDSGILEEINKFYVKPAVVLFGSFSYGLDDEISDIDLLLVSEKTMEFPETRKFEKILGREIHLFIVKDIKDIKNEHLINNILNGIILQGEVKWI